MADWMAFNVGTYVSNTMHLTTRQHGGYILLICAAWNGKGFLPPDEASLMAIAKLDAKAWQEDGPSLLAFLTRRGDDLVHERVEFEWNDAHALIAAKSKAGKEGARRRWHGRANSKRMADPLPTQSQNDAPLPLPVPLSNPKEGLERPTPRKERRHGASGTRIPEHWQPDEACRAFAGDRGLDPESTAGAFIDYWTANNGRNAVKRDWNAAFRTWCRRQDADARGSVGGGRVAAVRPARGNDAVFEHLAVLANQDRGGRST